jgi:hypothetical protein
MCVGIYRPFILCGRSVYHPTSVISGGEAQALQTVQVCKDIIAGRADLIEMNWSSLAWRGKLQTGSNRKLYP